MQSNNVVPLPWCAEMLAGAWPHPDPPPPARVVPASELARRRAARAMHNDVQADEAR